MTCQIFQECNVMCTKCSVVAMHGLYATRNGMCTPDCLRHAACVFVLWLQAGSHPLPLLLALLQAGSPDEQQQQTGDAGGDQARLQPPDARRGKELTATWLPTPTTAVGCLQLASETFHCCVHASLVQA